MKEQIVWKKKYKNGVEVVVVRTADYRGKLSINNKAGKSIFSTEVDLAGPLFDKRDWKNVKPLLGPASFGLRRVLRPTMLFTHSRRLHEKSPSARD